MSILSNALKVALRTIRKHPIYSSINITGFAVGLACCVLMGYYILDELRYDRFHEHADRVYRVVTDSRFAEAPLQRFATTSRHVGPAIREAYPEAEQVVWLRTWNWKIKHQGRYTFDDDFILTEPSFFEVFSFPLTQGDPATALEEPFSLVLTETAARKYFGREAILGQTLVLDDSLTFTITGVVADVPAQTHITFDFLVSWSTFSQRYPAHPYDWTNFRGYTYVRLREQASAPGFAAKIAGLTTRNFGEAMADIGLEITHTVQPLTRIYLHSDRLTEIGPAGAGRYVYVFSVIGLFVLLIACTNFVNLSTARSMERAQEIGVRKAVGSSRGALVRQFLVESVLHTLLALPLTLLFVVLALPRYSDLTGKTVGLDAFLTPTLGLSLVGLAVVIGMVAGSYPAFVLSGVHPIKALAGQAGSGGRGVWLRHGLVVFQFGISVSLIVCTLVVAEQLGYMQAKDLGFDQEQVLVVDPRSTPDAEMAQQYQTVKEQFSRHPSVQRVSASSHVPGRNVGAWGVVPEGLAASQPRRLAVLFADHDFIETMAIDLVAGRGLSTAFETDAEAATLLNEAAVKHLGWGSPDEALGKTILMTNDERQRTVVGVIKDYHHTALQQAIEPLAIQIFPARFNYFSLRITPDRVAETVAYLQQTWAQLFPAYSFTYFFLDDAFDQQYRAEQRLVTILGLFASLAILIACLGLFGLAFFMTARRTKEIGVRKVLGASTPGLVLRLSRDFVLLVGIAFVVAAPLAYFTMQRWLSGFAYRVDVGYGIFLLTGLLVLLVALLAVSYQSIKAARANPVNSLRYE